MRIKLALALGLVLMLGALTSRGDGLLDDMGINSEESRKSKNFTCLPKPPPPRPAQHSGAESLPPLPLPAVPLRRTEKKNPPRPPVLIAKIASGPRSNWATNPSDADNLLRWMARELDVNFSTINIPDARIPSDPQKIPILYRTGHDSFEFSDESRKRLRTYLMGGGTLIFDACCGRPEFARAAMTEMQKLIPERPPYRLALGHPVYHSYYDIKSIKCRPAAKQAGAKDNTANLIGIDLGCRTAVFFFRWDVSCGWDDLKDSRRHRCLGYDIPSAKRLGANLMAYIMSERNAAVPLSRALAYIDADQKKAGKFVIAQGIYQGVWKTREAGLSMLLNAFHKKTKAPVRFQRQQVELKSSKLFECPFVYLTGHNDFRLSKAARENLRRYLARGGVLFGEACCGRASFDRAFRREIRQTLPGSKLRPLPAGHMIYKYPNRLKGLTPRPALARKLNIKGKVAPRLEAINLNGNLAVVYSPFGLSCGWELAQCPYCLGIANNDALALGVNILSYILTQ